MADNIAITEGSGSLVAADDIATGVAAGAKVQRMKAGWGADGSYNDPSATTPIPVSVYPVRGVYTNASDLSLNTDATSQELFPASSTRIEILIQNPAISDGSIWINFGAAATVASPSFEFAPGKDMRFTGSVSNQAINWIAATAGHAIVAKEMN